jgi:hypothetical protein
MVGGTGMTPNEAIARKFADQFTPSLNVCRTERVNNVPMHDAWTIAYHDANHGIGITAVAYGNGLHAFIEAAGSGDIAEHAGKVMAKAIGLWSEPDGATEA